MRASVRFALMLSMLLLFPFQTKANEKITADIYFNRAGVKILSGVTNVATGWLELPKNIVIWRQKEKNSFVGFTEGMLRGIVHTASRTGSGALDLATFWLPTVPSPDPLYIWDDFYEESRYYAFRTSE
jgi:putative exosortase-associated protein (TIGR04073 family)